MVGGLGYTSKGGETVYRLIELIIDRNKWPIRLPHNNDPIYFIQLIQLLLRIVTSPHSINYTRLILNGPSLKTLLVSLIALYYRVRCNILYAYNT